MSERHLKILKPWCYLNIPLIAVAFRIAFKSDALLLYAAKVLFLVLLNLFALYIFNRRTSIDFSADLSELRDGRSPATSGFGATIFAYIILVFFTVICGLVIIGHLFQ